MPNTTIKGVNNTMKNKINSTPIQDESGILCFKLNTFADTDKCKDVYFSLENHKYSLNVNVEDERERVKEEVNSRSKHLYDWFKEDTGNKHWVLYDTEMYSVKYDSIGQWRYLNYREENALTQMDGALAPELPINASSCAFMFAFRKDLKKINLSNFSTEGVVTTKGMFAFCSNLKELDTSLLNTESVVDYTDMFRGCKALTKLDLCRFSLQSAKRTRGMFLGCTSLKEILTTKLFDTQDVLDGYKMFERCTSLPNYRNNILVQSAMARSIKDGGYLTMTSKRVLAQDIKALQS